MIPLPKNIDIRKPGAYTILTNHEGIVSTCGPDCYNNDHPYCICCCQTVNHDVGLSQAMINTIAPWFPTFLREYIDSHQDLFPEGGTISLVLIYTQPIPPCDSTPRKEN